jgi:hypothetical protein
MDYVFNSITFLSSILKTIDSIKAQGDSLQHSIAAERVRSQVTPCGTYDGQSDIGPAVL